MHISGQLRPFQWPTSLIDHSSNTNIAASQIFEWIRLILLNPEPIGSELVCVPCHSGPFQGVFNKSVSLAVPTLKPLKLLYYLTAPGSLHKTWYCIPYMKPSEPCTSSISPISNTNTALTNYIVLLNSLRIRINVFFLLVSDTIITGRGKWATSSYHKFLFFYYKLLADATQHGDFCKPNAFPAHVSVVVLVFFTLFYNPLSTSPNCIMCKPALSNPAQS
jgi:hypothetical protein